MKTTTASLLILLLCINVACSPGGSEAQVMAEGAPTPATAEPAAASATHPCDAFTLADLNSMFEVGGEEVTAERGQVPGNLTCSYQWKKPDWQAIEERRQAAMMKAVLSGRSPLDLLGERSENELFITFHEGNFRSTAEAVRGLDAMVERLTRGISASSGDVTMEFQYDFEPVAGIGAKAVWSPDLRQLSAVSGILLYHIRVRMHEDPAANRTEAEAVARRIAAALR